MKNYVLPVLIMLVFLSGCSTSASFILPQDTALMINDERVNFESKDEDGRPRFKTRPFFWTSIIGIEYRLIQNNKIIKEDRLPSDFRVASIFWPPYAIFYWPVGFRFDCYDLSDPQKEFLEECEERDKITSKDESQNP